VEAIKIFTAAMAVYFCPWLFNKLMSRWFPDEPLESAGVLRVRFWRSFILVLAVIGGVLLFQQIRHDTLRFASGDWLRVLAAIIAVTAALARGGWSIQTWKGRTVIERIDRGTFVISQLGTAALLVFVLTLGK
jgi:hypothetical protein